jgi:hypothetical protein
LLSILRKRSRPFSINDVRLILAHNTHLGLRASLSSARRAVATFLASKEIRLTGQTTDTRAVLYVA